MIAATHIIGLTPIERGVCVTARNDSAQLVQATVAIAQRWQQIAADGWLLARAYQPTRATNRAQATGRSFAFDDLAGDDQYVFLATPARFTDLPAAARWGWQFDADQLIHQGAAVCPRDLGTAFGNLTWTTCVEVSATLPRRAPEANLAAFAELLNDDNPGTPHCARSRRRRSGGCVARCRTRHRA